MDNDEFPWNLKEQSLRIRREGDEVRFRNTYGI